jgi:hypothetical protein
MVGYTIIILSSLRGIVVRKFNNLLFVGDIIMAFALLVSSMRVSLGGANGEEIRDMVMTPAVIIWAMVHFVELLNYKAIKKEKKGRIQDTNGKQN